MRSAPSAAVAAAEVELCTACVEHEGLCAPCTPSVVPQLKRPSWHRDVHVGDRHHDAETVSLAPEPSPDVVKQLRKTERRDAKRKGPKCYDRPNPFARLGRALAGAFTPVRPSPSLT